VKPWELLGQQPRTRRNWWYLIAGVLAVGLLLSPWLIIPSHPREIVIATGSPDGAYYAFAERYREILARDGITLTIRTTAGSIENQRLLRDGSSGVSLAFIQGGTVAGDESELRSLASLYREPLWLFCRTEAAIHRLTDLSGRSIAVGAEGSGTQAISVRLLAENGISADGENPAMFLSMTSADAATALRNGEIDAAFFVVAPQAPLIAELLADEGVQLMDFDRAPAYERRYPFLSRVVLREGMVDLPRNLPDTDVALIAPTANLVARGDLHPAFVPLLLGAATEVHERGGLLESPGEFPSDLHVDCEMNRDAKRYLRSGPPMLFRYLPFSVAATIDRMKLMLLPLCTLLVPLFKTAPPVYRWRIRRRIFLWYGVLREIDQRLKTASPRNDFAEDICRLEVMEREVAEVSVPLSYMEEFYNLRLHLAFVQDKLLEQQQQSTLEPAT